MLVPSKSGRLVTCFWSIITHFVFLRLVSSLMYKSLWRGNGRVLSVFLSRSLEMQTFIKAYRAHYRKAEHRAISPVTTREGCFLNWGTPALCGTSL